MRKEVIGDATLYNADCRDIFPLIDKVDAVVTDPPYGIKADENPVKGISLYGKTAWDRDIPAKDIFESIFACSKHQIIWGGNYFTEFLPPSMGWLVWNKIRRNFSLADGELAWMSMWKAMRIYDMAQAAGRVDGIEHPTQKPIRLMKWCLEQLPVDSRGLILDPFCGSGTTGVAAIQGGYRFIGIEREEKYFEIALRRITEAVNNGAGLFNI